MGKKKNLQSLDDYAIIAHRGLHGNGVCENSLKAFSLAMENCLPFEFDVHLSKDGRLIVCHDSDLERVCGKKGYIPSLTVEEIKANYRLNDGQEVPTIEEVLELTKGDHRIVLELKVDEGNNKKIAQTALEAISSIKDKSKVTIISFYPAALRACRKQGYLLGLLVCDKHPIMKRLSFLFDYLDVEDCLLDDKYYANYRRKGGKVNVWTIEKEEQLRQIAGKVDMITFQHLPIDRVKEALK